MLIAFAEFGGIILYCLYINYLYKIECCHDLVMKMKKITFKFKFRNEDDEILDNYERYQEELLAVDLVH